MSRATPKLFICISLLLTSLFCAAELNAASWNVDASGNWSDTLNWLGGSVPNAPAAVADFSTIDITADRTITLDIAPSVGSLTFGDTNTATAGSWIIGGTNALTLDNGGGTPTITVNALPAPGKSAAISVSLFGTNGLTKAGLGTLSLSGTNNYSGTTTLSAGTL